MLRNWRVFALVLTFAVIGSIYYVLTATPMYTANGALLIDPRVGQAPNNTVQTQQGIGSLDGLTVDSELRVLTSREVTTRTIEELGFSTVSADDVPKQPSIRDRLEKLFRLADDPEPETNVSDTGSVREQRSSEALRRTFVQNLKAERAGDSYVIDVRYTSPDLEFAAEAVNTLMREYLSASGQQQVEQVKRTGDWLSDRIKTLEVSVREAETAVAEFRGANELVALRGELLPTEIALNAAIEDLIRLRSDALVSQVQVQQLSEQIESGDVDAIQVPPEERSNALNEFQTVYAGLLREERDMLLSWADNAPIIQSVQQRQEQIRALILDEYRQLRDRLIAQNEALARQATATDAVITDLRAQHSDSIRETVELRNLEREAAAKRQLYERLLEEFNSTSQLLTFDATSARVIAWAVPPDKKSAPQSRQIVVLAVFGALVLSLSIIYLHEAFDGSFRTYDEIGQSLGLTFLGLVPAFQTEEDTGSLLEHFTTKRRQLRKTLKDRGLTKLASAGQRLGFASFRNNSVTAETMRAIHVQLMLQSERTNRNKKCQVIGFASTKRGEGKTTASFNLASFLAQQNERVAIVDLDLASQEMSKLLVPILPATSSLPDFLDDPHDAMAKLEPLKAFHGLFFISNTPQDQKPLSMMRDQKRIEDMLSVLRQNFDYVILDLSPVQGVADTRLLVELADKLIYTIRWGTTPRSQVLSVFKQRLILKKRILGVIYTRAKIQKYRWYNRNDMLDYYS